VAKLTPQERLAVAEKRLVSVLGRHGVATSRTIEQKIADAGPTNQRIDPHIITQARSKLSEKGIIKEYRRGGAPWYYLAAADKAFVDKRLALLAKLHAKATKNAVTMKVGQTLEIAVFRALGAATEAKKGQFLGGFLDLDEHDDGGLYKKEEPKMFSGRKAPQGRCLDFIAVGEKLGAGIEVKNLREWIYPQREEVKALLSKALAFDVVPVLIARRIHFSAFSVLNRCGVILHQTYNQLYPNSEAELAGEVKQKDLLGYHDVRVGNEPDARLLKFTGENLWRVLPSAREKFEEYKDLIEAYCSGEMDYAEFSGRSKRRFQGEDEDGEAPWEVEIEEP
jgi:Holliday junction resolvase